MKYTWMAIVACALIGTTAGAQTNTNEVEPNQAKPQATPTSACMLPGDTLTGATTSSSITATGLASADTWLVAVCAGATGLYEQRLTITTTGAVGHTGSLRGLTQTNGVPNGGTDATTQTSVTTTTPPRMNQWFGFGHGEQIYYRVAGTASTTANYVATFSSTQLTPAIVAATFTPGPITVTSQGQGHNTDTELYIYDGNFDPVPTAHNDDFPPPTITVPAALTRTLAPGTYYVAIAPWNIANSNGDANADESFLTGILLDFPDAMISDLVLAGQNVAFSISDGVTTVPVVATRTNPYQVVWTCFQVGTPPTFEAFCAGDGALTDHTTPCPCANNGAAGNGCANSVNPAGANLTATGTAAADNVVLNGSGMPATVSCIYLQGDGLDDVIFGDGTRCTGGTLIRLRTRANVGGASSFPDSTDTVTLSQRGSVTVGSGARRYYQTYYRNSAPAFCPPETFNVTNGWVVDW